MRIESADGNGLLLFCWQGPDESWYCGGITAKTDNNGDSKCFLGKSLIRGFSPWPNGLGRITFLADAAMDVDLYTEYKVRVELVPVFSGPSIVAWDGLLYVDDNFRLINRFSGPTMLYEGTPGLAVRSSETAFDDYGVDCPWFYCPPV